MQMQSYPGERGGAGEGKRGDIPPSGNKRQNQDWNRRFQNLGPGPSALQIHIHSSEAVDTMDTVWFSFHIPERLLEPFNDREKERVGGRQGDGYKEEWG